MLGRSGGTRGGSIWLGVGNVHVALLLLLLLLSGGTCICAVALTVVHERAVLMHLLRDRRHEESNEVRIVLLLAFELSRGCRRVAQHFLLCLLRLLCAAG